MAQGGQAGPAGGRGGNDVQICGVTLKAESKIFFLDLKENARGKYVKISERGLNRERSTIVVPPAAVEWFIALLKYFIAPPPQEQASSKQLRVESKVFFFEPGENSRGRFLRISESCPGSRGNSSLIVPSGGASCSAWAGLHDALERMALLYLSPTAELTAAAAAQTPVDSGGQQLLSQQQQPSGIFPPETQGAGSPTMLDVAGPGQLVGPGPSAPTIGRTKDGIQVLRVGHKRFYFDLGSNQKGDFLRITEQTAGVERMAIIVPGAALEQFSAALQECIAQQRARAGD